MGEPYLTKDSPVKRCPYPFWHNAHGWLDGDMPTACPGKQEGDEE